MSRILLAALLVAGCSPAARPPADETEKARQAEFEAHLRQGKEALDAKRHDEAIEILTRAAEMMPSNQAARDLLSRARDGKVQAAYDLAMARGREAVAAKDHERAIAAFTEALRHWPRDREAAAGRRDAEFALRLDQGNQALAANRLDEAIKAFAAATQLKPEDQTARDLLKKAEGTRAAQVKEEFGRAMEAGDRALDASDYQAATDAFTRALALVPGDKEATSKRKEAEFYLHLERGRRALKEKRYGDAVTALETAARLRPGNKTAVNLLREARAKGR